MTRDYEEHRHHDHDHAVAKYLKTAVMIRKKTADISLVSRNQVKNTKLINVLCYCFGAIKATFANNEKIKIILLRQSTLLN
jgi:hypothetical protein